MTRAAAATTPNTHTHTSYTWTKICKQKAIACPSLRFAAHLIFSCHVPPGLNLAQRWKQPGAEVEADARKVLVHTKAMSCFPTTHSPGCKVHWCDPCLTSGPGMSTGTFQKRQFRTRVSVARMCRQGCECVDEPDLYTQSARINTADGLEHGDRTPYGYFKMFYPMAHLAKTLELTSAKLRKAGHRALTKQEFFVFVGVLIGTALFPKQSRRQLFTPAERQRHRYMSNTVNMSQFMRLSRYEAISSYLTFNNIPSADQCFWKIQPLVDAFNALRRRVVVPGRVICADESFSWWDGSEGSVQSEGLPNVTKMKEKPRGIGLMIKNVCDGQSGIMLKIELVASKAEMATREFNAELGSGTGYLLRLTRDQWGSGRVVVADSAFASVKSAGVEAQRVVLHWARQNCPPKVPEKVHEGA